MAEWEGRILHRGGEELQVKKTIDRFTVALSPADAVQLGSKLNAEHVRDLLSLSLVEFRVAPERLDETMQIARSLPKVQFASHVYEQVYEQDDNLTTPIYLTNQITVQFAETTDARVMKTIADALGLQVVKLVPGVSQTFVFEVTPRASVNPIKLAHRLLKHPQVLMVEPNVAVAIRHYADSHIGSHPEEHRETLSSPQPQPQPTVQVDLQANGVLLRGDRSIVIAVAEQAIEWNQPGLQGMGTVVAPLELSGQLSGQNEENATQSPKSRIQNLAEVVPDCAFMPIGVGDWLDDSLIEQICQEVIAAGAAVLVCAWSAEAAYFPLSLRQRTALFRAATQGRNSQGCVIVFAARAVDRPAMGTPEPIDENWQSAMQSLNGFAVHPGVLLVAASPIPAGTAHWETGGWEADNWQTGISVCAASQGGNGEASAIVAGVAALMLSANPNLIARAVKRMLQDTADRLSPTEHSKSGQYDALGYSPQYGYGQVNALRAVQAAWQSVEPLEIPDRWIEPQNTSPLEILREGEQGGYSAIVIQDAGLIKSIEVSLEIEHGFVGDLEIFLISPRGEEILLQNRTLGRITRLRKTYDAETTPLLQKLLNQTVTGQWQLKIVDRVMLNTGQLQQWQLRVGVAFAALQPVVPITHHSHSI